MTGGADDDRPVSAGDRGEAVAGADGVTASWIGRRAGERPGHLVIRPATAADAAACGAGAREVAATSGGLASRPHEIRDDALREHILALADGVRGAFLVAELDGALVGHAWLERYALEATSHVAHLSMAVHEGFQGRGVGRALLEALIAAARAHPAIEKLELRVRANNTRARALYASAGFVVEGVFSRRVRVAADYVDDVSMALFVAG